MLGSHRTTHSTTIFGDLPQKYIFLLTISLRWPYQPKDQLHPQQPCSPNDTFHSNDQFYPANQFRQDNQIYYIVKYEAYDPCYCNDEFSLTTHFTLSTYLTHTTYCIPTDHFTLTIYLSLTIYFTITSHLPKYNPVHQATNHLLPLFIVLWQYPILFVLPFHRNVVFCDLLGLSHARHSIVLKIWLRFKLFLNQKLVQHKVCQFLIFNHVISAENCSAPK